MLRHRLRTLPNLLIVVIVLVLSRMAKYLRCIASDFTDADGRGDAELYAPVRAAPCSWHLTWMYEHYAVPMRSDGIVKVNVFFTSSELNRAPDDLLDVSIVYERFDAVRFAWLAPKEQQRYFVDRLHTAMLRCAAHFGWTSESLVQAHDRIIAEDFEFRFWWRKPLASPDRKAKVQALIEACHPARLYLVFFDREMREQQRTLLSSGLSGRGGVEFILGDVRWQDSNTVKVQHKNGRDYWLCGTDGSVSFHYPRADSGDPHGEFDLGKMYYEGRYVLQDQARGLLLIERAAAKGFAHARNFLTAARK